MLVENTVHELALVGLNICGGIFSWQFVELGRKWIALFVFVGTIALILVLAKHWQIDLSYV